MTFYYCRGEEMYTLEQCILKFPQAWADVLFCDIAMECSALTVFNNRIKPQDWEIPGMYLSLIVETIEGFEEFLEKHGIYPCVDERDDPTTVDYATFFLPFKNILQVCDNIE